MLQALQMNYIGYPCEKYFFEFYHLIIYKMRIVCFVLAIVQSLSYLDLPLTVQYSQMRVDYKLEMLVNSYPYNLTISLNNQQQYLQNLTQVSKIEMPFPSRLEEKNPNYIFGQIRATSLEGYSFQGWKRFFREVLLYIEQRYYHDITINLDNIKQRNVDNSEKSRGLITFGPDLSKNIIYQEMKKNTFFIERNVVAIYHGLQDNIRLQLGGYEESYAKDDKNGDHLFHKIQLSILERLSNKILGIVVPSCSIKLFDSHQYKYYSLTSAPVLFYLNIQSPEIVLPKSYIMQMVQNFNNHGFSCTVPVDKDYLKCKNMTGIEASLTYISFNIVKNENINVSLHWLIKQVNSSNDQITFYVRAGESNNLVIGAALFREYYIVVDYDKNELLYSPINHYKSQFTSVFFLRFGIYFIVFLVIAAVGTAFYQLFFDPSKNNKIKFTEQGMQIITYQRPCQIQFE